MCPDLISPIIPRYAVGNGAARKLVLNRDVQVRFMVLRSLSVLLCWLGIGLAPAAAQTVALDLAQAKNCLSCHRVDKKVVGPSLTVIAERFAGQEGAQGYLAQAIRNGGRGRWGPVPMPAQPQVSPADAQLLAAWILSLAEKAEPEQPQVKE